jgi:SulP family sulfate permease
MGTLLLAMALILGAGLADLLTNFPLSILAGLLATAGILHITLLRDLKARSDWAVAVLVGVLGLFGWLAVGLVVGVVLAWLVGRTKRRVFAG